MVSRTLSTEELMRAVAIPLPSKPLCIPARDSTERICQRLDLLFEELIAQYKNREIKEYLRWMYYEDANVAWVPNFCTKSKGRFTAMCYCEPSNIGPAVRVEIDASLQLHPVAEKVMKIHEIGIHAGQYYQHAQLLGALGPYSFEQFATPQFLIFSELSAALSDKTLSNAVPLRVLEEIRAIYLDDGNHLRPGMQALQGLELYLRQNKGLALDHFTSLSHHPQHQASAPLTQKGQGLFLSHPRVQHYLEHVYPHTVPHADDAGRYVTNTELGSRPRC